MTEYKQVKGFRDFRTGQPALAHWCVMCGFPVGGDRAMLDLHQRDWCPLRRLPRAQWVGFPKGVK